MPHAPRPDGQEREHRRGDNQYHDGQGNGDQLHPRTAARRDQHGVTPVAYRPFARAGFDRPIQRVTSRTGDEVGYVFGPEGLINGHEAFRVPAAGTNQP